MHARFDANDDGSRFDMNAFTGRVVSQLPATVRIRTGELPFLQKEQMRRVPVQKADAGATASTP